MERKVRKKSEEDLPQIDTKNSKEEDELGITLEDKLYQFIDEQISKVRSYSSLGGGQIGFYELQRALSEWSDIHLSLVALDTMAKEEQRKATDNFDEWMSDKYMKAREALNPTSLSAQKWASSKELEYYVRNNFKDEFKKLKEEKDIADSKVAFVRRLLENINQYSYNLGILSKNVQTEVAGLNTQADFEKL